MTSGSEEFEFLVFLAFLVRVLGFMYFSSNAVKHDCLQSTACIHLLSVSVNGKKKSTGELMISPMLSSTFDRIHHSTVKRCFQDVIPVT